jgi:GTPase KRas protein
MRTPSLHPSSHPSSASIRPSLLPSNSGEEISLAVMGPAAVGKSCITLRYVQRIFVEDYTNTVEDRFQKVENIDGKLTMLNLLDTSGEEDFVSLRQMWLQGKDAVLLVFSMADRKSLVELENFYTLIQLLGPTEGMPIALVANKLDLKREVSSAEIEEVAKKWGAGYFEISAKTGERVDEVFAWLVRKVREGRKKGEERGEEDGGGTREEGWMKKMFSWCNLI